VLNTRLKVAAIEAELSSNAAARSEHAA
jgi:hypothetical protein